MEQFRSVANGWSYKHRMLFGSDAIQRDTSSCSDLPHSFALLLVGETTSHSGGNFVVPSQTFYSDTYVVLRNQNANLII